MIKLSEKRFLRPDEVAKLRNVAKSTVYGWVRDGILEGTKFGRTLRITPEAIQKMSKSTISD